MQKILAAFALMLATMAMISSVTAQEAYVPGVHYEIIDEPVATEDPEKIEVTEVFWYGCGHCFHFEPLIQKWKKTLADDVNFVASPAIWNKPMEVHAKAFYTAKALDKLDEIHQPLFDALNVDGKKLVSEKALAKFFADFGIDQETFDRTYNSFSISSLAKKANDKARKYGVQGTPELIVDGKYRVTGRLAGSQENMIKVADFLVNKVRNQQ